MMAFPKKVIPLLMASSDYFNILLMIPDGPEDLSFFIFSIARTISSFVINGAGQRTASTGGRLFSDQGNSAFKYLHNDPAMLVF